MERPAEITTGRLLSRSPSTGGLEAVMEGTRVVVLGDGVLQTVDVTLGHDTVLGR